MPTPEPPQPHFPSPYQRPRTAPVEARHIKTDDGAHIAAYVYGDRPEDGDDPARAPVLFLHGNGEEHGIFGPMIDAVIERGYTAVALDSRAQGRSTRGTSRLSYELMAQDALVCLRSLGVTQAQLVGFSDGAIEALIIARDHPELACSLLSMGANLTPEGIIDTEGWDIAGTIHTHTAWASWIQSLPADSAVDTTLLCPTADKAQDIADLLGLMLEEPQIEAASLSTIVCPTTIMAGEDDCVLLSETEAIVAGIRSGGNADVRLVIVPEAGHSLPKEVPETVTKELLALLSRAEQGA